MAHVRSLSSQGSRCVRLRCPTGRRVHVEAVQSPSYLGTCPPQAAATVQAIREAVAHSTCGPYAEIATEDTLVINPPWADEPRATGISHAECGVVTDTTYAEENVRPIAASYETDGSVFLLWERKAEYTQGGRTRSEDICGVTYVKMSSSNKATVIATFRQPSPEELEKCFKPNAPIQIRPGADNFFSGVPYRAETPVAEQQMVSAVRAYFAAWKPGSVEADLAAIASPKLHVYNPIWEEKGQYLPVNRVEAAMGMERLMKISGGELTLEPKSVAHAEGTNMVFALWFAQGPKQPEVAGLSIFFFGEDLKISAIAQFREPFKTERSVNLP